MPFFVHPTQRHLFVSPLIAVHRRTPTGTRLNPFLSLAGQTATAAVP
jgi:hypothetical protein